VATASARRRRSGGDGQPFLLPAQLQRFGRGGDFHQQFAQRGGKAQAIGRDRDALAMAHEERDAISSSSVRTWWLMALLVRWSSFAANEKF